MIIIVSLFALMIVISVAIVILYMTAMSARNSGWRCLAEHYSADRPLPKRRLPYVTISLDGIVLQRIIILAVDDAALYLRPTVLFRSFHPTLRIPWQELRATATTGTLRIAVPSAPDIELILDDTVRAALFELLPTDTTRTLASLRPA